MAAALWISGIGTALAIAVAAVGGPAGLAVEPVRATAGPAGAATAGCADCHVAIHDEWRESRHGAAWRDPAYQRALRDRARPERCHGCHAPQPVQERLGRQPWARDAERDHGVDCAACHAWRGRIAGPFGAATDAHDSVAHPAFRPDGSIALCGSCHDTTIGPVLALARDFRDAQLAERGKSCIGCHMPAVTRAIATDGADGAPLGPERRGRSHALRGPGDPEFCATAFKLGVEVVQAAGAEWLELSVGNRAGHRVPGLTTRSFHFRLQPLTADGRAAGAPLLVTIGADNLLAVAETRRFRLPRPPGATAVELEVEHEHGEEKVVLTDERQPL
ncbi:MAG: hypothetical protein IPM29_00895 [Planctomycetes bacterium]|nr:hypothetical protein [Planctomycetota bacterium]